MRLPGTILFLEAIAKGATTYGEIASKSGAPTESLSKYLRVLEEMEFIARITPIIGNGRARYTIADRFLVPLRAEA